MIQPLNGYLILKQKEKETITELGIILSETVKTFQDTGEVVALGEDNPFNLKLGDQVFFDKFAANEFKHEKETYISIHQDSLIAKL